MAASATMGVTPRRGVLALLTAAAGAHAVYVVRLLGAAHDGRGAEIRALSSLVAAVVLTIVHTRVARDASHAAAATHAGAAPATHGAGAVSAATWLPPRPQGRVLGVVLAATTLAAAGLWWTPAFTLAPAALIAASLAAYAIDPSERIVAAGNRLWIPIALALLAYPHETLLGPAVDAGLQLGTAWAAAPLVTLTGLPVHVATLSGPVLQGVNLTVHVTSLCAGTQTLLAMLTLALVLAAVWIDTAKGRAIFVLLTPVVGAAGNIVRVALSTHAANLWAGDLNARTWDVAHDVIGYATFVGVYATLFWLVRRLRARSRANVARR